MTLSALTSLVFVIAVSAAGPQQTSSSKELLTKAVEAGDIVTAKRILTANAELATEKFGSEKEPILSIAMHAQPKPRLEMLKVLIEAGADVNATSSTKGISPLMVAAENCHAGAAEYLLKKHEAEPDLSAYDGSTALISAVFAACSSVVEVLIKNCARLDQTFKGAMGPETALQIARDQDDPDFFDYVHNKQIVKMLDEAVKKPPCPKLRTVN